jgi:Heavy metal associated domain 2
MALEVYIHHHLPGRLRLRVPAGKGEERELREISSAIARSPGINQVEYNPITGSVLIQYSRDHYRSLRALESGLNSSGAPITVNNSHYPHYGPGHRHHVRGRSIAARRIDLFFTQLDHEIREASNNEVDLKFILPFGVGILGLLALRYSSTTPLWLTLLIFAFNSFVGLHAPMPGELGLIPEALGE